MKKIISIIIAIVIIVGITMTAITGFNLGLDYTNSKKVTIYLGKDFNMDDIKNITNEIFGKQDVILEKLRPFEDVLSIRTKEVNDTQIKRLNEEINKKYELENKEEDFQKLDLPAPEFKDVVSPYVSTIIIFVVGVTLYEMIAYRKLGMVKVALKTILTMIISLLILFSVIEICGFTINMYIVSAILAVEFISIGMLTASLEKQNRKMKVEEAKQNK